MGYNDRQSFINWREELFVINSQIGSHKTNEGIHNSKKQINSGRRYSDIQAHSHTQAHRRRVSNRKLLNYSKNSRSFPSNPGVRTVITVGIWAPLFLRLQFLSSARPQFCILLPPAMNHSDLPVNNPLYLSPISQRKTLHLIM